MKRTAFFIFTSLLVCVSMIACSSTSKMSTLELYNEAYGFYNDESYIRAQSRFEEIIERDPLNKYAVLSELHLAYIYFEKDDYDESLIHFEEYLRLNPRAEEYEYVLYMISMCHFNMIKTYDRDQTETDISLKKFSEYLEKYPAGKYASEISKNVDIAESIKLKSEYSVGRFYFKMKEYNSAVVRCENILLKYKKGDMIEETYLILAKSLDKLFKEDKLRAVYDDYIAKYPSGRFKSDILRLIDEKS